MAVTSTDQWWGEKLKIVQQENEALKQMIAGKGGSPGQPYDDPEKGKGPFVPAPPRDKLMIAHGEGRGPQPKYHDEYNQPIKGRKPWEQMFPDGTLREIPWMKEQYLQEHPELADSRRRDLMIRQAVGAYGKHPKTGEYIDPEKLLLSLPRA